nr:hypothetical protein [Tanacetum cinerariifolium]
MNSFLPQERQIFKMKFLTFNNGLMNCHEAWDRYKDLLHACPHHGFTESHQLDTFYNALNPADQDSLNFAAGGNLLERRTQDVLTIIENKSKQTKAVTTAMTAILKQFQVTPPLASVKSDEEICVTCGGAHPYYQSAVNHNQGNFGYRPLSVANQIRPPGFAQPNVQNNQNRFSQPQGYNQENNFNQDTSYQAQIQQNQVVPLSELEKIKKMNEINIKAMQTQINNVKNELINEMKTSIQVSMSNQTNELKNMMASFFQMNTASTSGSGPLPSNIIANPKGKLKAITTRSVLVLDGRSVPMPPPFINSEEDERTEETLTDPDLVEYNIKQEKDEIQIHKFWKMFKQLHINITLADALILILKYQKMLKSLLSNKEKHLKLENTRLNENCLVVILKKLPEKLRDPGKFLISYGFSELKCKDLADLGSSINLMLLSVWKKVRDVFVPVGKFTFLVDFVIVDYESDPQVPLILGRPFLRTARALIDVHEEEMILRDGDERLNLNIRHDISSYSNLPLEETINMINIYNDSYENYLKILFAINHLSGNPTFSSHTDLTSPKVINPLSGSTTSSPDHLLEEFADELALITFPPGNNDLPFDIESDLREIEYLLNHDPTKEMDSILEDSVDEDNLADPNNNLVDTIPEMFTDEHTLDYSSPPLYDDVDDDLVKLESDNEYVYDDLFDSKDDKIKESKLLIDELDPPRSSDFLPSPDYDSNLSEVTNRVATDKNVKKISISNASLILEDFNPPLYELPFHKEVLGSKTLFSFSSENEEKVFKPGILTSKGPGHLAARLGYAKTKVATWDDLAFKLIILGWNVKHRNIATFLKSSSIVEIRN